MISPEWAPGVEGYDAEAVRAEWRATRDARLAAEAAAKTSQA